MLKERIPMVCPECGYTTRATCAAKSHFNRKHPEKVMSNNSAVWRLKEPLRYSKEEVQVAAWCYNSSTNPKKSKYLRKFSLKVMRGEVYGT